ncbi:hypothetical protein [Streptomyces sp. NPDC058653]|uniref:hypothetical protein n=1 Tax=Streptomyces sp. NPDC058653 TaxID=3346576 RepID=UPI00365F2A0D
MTAGAALAAPGGAFAAGTVPTTGTVPASPARVVSSTDRATRAVPHGQSAPAGPGAGPPVGPWSSDPSEVNSGTSVPRVRSTSAGDGRSGRSEP